MRERERGEKRRERERKRERETGNRCWVDVVAANIPAATVPNFDEKREERKREIRERERERKRGKERERGEKENERERQTDTERETGNWCGVDIVAANITPATVPNFEEKERKERER